MNIAAGVVRRLLLAGAVALPAALVYGEALVASCLPAYRAVFAWVAGDFDLVALAIDREGADLVLRARVMWRHAVVIGHHVIPPDPRGIAEASTLLAHALQAPILAMLTALAWPARARCGCGGAVRPSLEWGARAVALLPLLVALVVFDMPVVLAGELQQLVFEALDPGATSALVVGKQFLQAGGRHALGLAAGALAVIAACRLGVCASRARCGSYLTTIRQVGAAD